MNDNLQLFCDISFSLLRHLIKEAYHEAANEAEVSGQAQSTITFTSHFGQNTCTSTRTRACTFGVETAPVPDQSSGFDPNLDGSKAKAVAVLILVDWEATSNSNLNLTTPGDGLGGNNHSHPEGSSTKPSSEETKGEEDKKKQPSAALPSGD